MSTNQSQRPRRFYLSKLRSRRLRAKKKRTQRNLRLEFCEGRMLLAGPDAGVQPSDPASVVSNPVIPGQYSVLQIGAVPTAVLEANSAEFTAVGGAGGFESIVIDSDADDAYGVTDDFGLDVSPAGDSIGDQRNATWLYQGIETVKLNGDFAIPQFAFDPGLDQTVGEQSDDLVPVPTPDTPTITTLNPDPIAIDPIATVPTAPDPIATKPVRVGSPLVPPASDPIVASRPIMPLENISTDTNPLASITSTPPVKEHPSDPLLQDEGREDSERNSESDQPERFERFATSSAVQSIDEAGQPVESKPNANMTWLPGESLPGEGEFVRLVEQPRSIRTPAMAVPIHSRIDIAKDRTFAFASSATLTPAQSVLVFEYQSEMLRDLPIAESVAGSFEVSSFQRDHSTSPESRSQSDNVRTDLDLFEDNHSGNASGAANDQDPTDGREKPEKAARTELGLSAPLVVLAFGVMLAHSHFTHDPQRCTLDVDRRKI